MTGVVEIARRAGVSPATVSRVLNGRTGVRAETRAAVLAAARALGHKMPSSAERAGQRNGSATVGVLLSRQGSPFGSKLHRAIQNRLAPEGYLALVCSTHAEPERERAYVQMLLEMELGGVIIRPSASLRQAARHAEKFERAGIPVVFCETAPEGDGNTQVVTDNFAGGRAAIRHLYSLGHRDIAILLNGRNRRQRSGSPGLTRLEGALAEARELGIGHRIRLSEEFPSERFAYGRAAMRAILGAGARPTAVFAGTDMIALGAMDAILQAGLSVPQDISVLGFDGIDLWDIGRPELSTLDQQIDLLGETAANLLIARMRGEKVRLQRITHQPQLRLRASLGTARMPAASY